MAEGKGRKTMKQVVGWEKRYHLLLADFQQATKLLEDAQKEVSNMVHDRAAYFKKDLDEHTATLLKYRDEHIHFVGDPHEGGLWRITFRGAQPVFLVSMTFDQVVGYLARCTTPSCDGILSIERIGLATVVGCNSLTQIHSTEKEGPVK